MNDTTLWAVALGVGLLGLVLVVVAGVVPPTGAGAWDWPTSAAGMATTRAAVIAMGYRTMSDARPTRGHGVHGPLRTLPDPYVTSLCLCR